MIRELFEAFRKNNLLSQAFDQCAEMLQLDRDMFHAAVHSLRESDDSRLSMDIYAADRKINAFEMDVRRKVLTHMAVSSGTDLSAGLILVSIVIDIERIGDYTKNIVDLALRHPTRLNCGVFEKDISRMEKTVGRAFDALISAIPESDADVAAEVMSEHWWIGRHADDIVYQLLERDAEKMDSRDAVAIALYARYLKRISAHLMNAASSIVNPFERIGFRRDGSGPSTTGTQGDN